MPPWWSRANISKSSSPGVERLRHQAIRCLEILSFFVRPVRPIPGGPFTELLRVVNGYVRRGRTGFRVRLSRPGSNVDRAPMPEPAGRQNRTGPKSGQIRILRSER